MMNTHSLSASMLSSVDEVSLQEFDDLCRQEANQNDYPLVSKVEKNILIYEGDALRVAIEDNQLQIYQSEMAHALSRGPGVLVIENFFANVTYIDQMNLVFEDLFEIQSLKGSASDHFAKAGANSRIWNSFQKCAKQSPEVFIDYYKNPLLRLVCEAWLGPHYQLTAQVNVVHPGGRSQHSHRDYHLGFQVDDEVARYPLHAQVMSQYLTLQGAVAHSDMPVKSGPTQLLPYSQQYPLGYLAWRKNKFKQYFAENSVQLPLKKGDALFFNPALFHAAGNNDTTDIDRIANLLQISSAFAKPMETVDLYQVVRHIYPSLLEKLAQITKAELKAITMGACDGYSFPSNLDTDPPIDGMAPITVEQLTQVALKKGWPPEYFDQQLQTHFEKRQS